MKSIYTISAALLALSLPALSQTSTIVQPIISQNGQVTVGVKDSSGGQHLITFPVIAVTNLSVGSGSDVYTPPVVTDPPPTDPPPVNNGAPTIPSNAVSVSLIKAGTWKACEHDAGTPGTGTCSNNYPVTGIFSDDARAFSMTYANGGGIRWANSFAKDTKSTNFVLDGNFMSPDWSHVANLELDDNVVLANGKTAILGTQCSTYSKTWEVTLIAPQSNWHWQKTNVPCNTPKWLPNVPYHVRIFGTVSSTGVSTYVGVELNGVYTAFTNMTGTTAEALGWSIGTLLTNVQIDGLSTSGSATVYADKLNILRW